MSLKKKFEQIDGEMILQMIEDREPESLHLDFKEVPNGVTKEIRKIFAKSLSGYANSDGGMIVWGVEARKTEDGIDGASSAKQIPDVKLVCSKFDSLISEATSPSLEQVHQKVIETDGRGFIITLVEKNKSSICMAKLGLNQYYKRSGESFQVMEHFEIEAMFGRRLLPKIEPLLILSLGTYSADSGSFLMKIALKNSGCGSAEQPTVHVEGTLGGFVSKSTPAIFELHDSINERASIFQGANNLAIHPQTSMDIAAFRMLSLMNRSELTHFDLKLWVSAKGLGAKAFRVHFIDHEYREYFDSLLKRECTQIVIPFVPIDS